MNSLDVFIEPLLSFLQNSEQQLGKDPLDIFHGYDALIRLEETSLLDPAKIQFIRNVFHRCFTLFETNARIQTETLTPAYLQAAFIAFEGEVAAALKERCLAEGDSEGAAKAQEGARTIAKAILKATERSQFDLKLWHAYGAVEERLGRKC